MTGIVRQHASVILQMSLTARVCCGLQACGETLGEDWKKERGLSVFVCTLRLRTREDVGETESLGQRLKLPASSLNCTHGRAKNRVPPAEMRVLSYTLVRPRFAQLLSLQTPQQVGCTGAAVHPASQASSAQCQAAESGPHPTCRVKDPERCGAHVFCARRCCRWSR